MKALETVAVSTCGWFLLLSFRELVTMFPPRSLTSKWGQLEGAARVPGRSRVAVPDRSGPFLGCPLLATWGSARPLREQARGCSWNSWALWPQKHLANGGGGGGRAGALEAGPTRGGARLAGRVSTVIKQQPVQIALCPRPQGRERPWGCLLGVALPSGAENQACLGRTVHPTGAEVSQQSRGRALPHQGSPSSGLWEAALVFRSLAEIQPLLGQLRLPHSSVLQSVSLMF